MKNYLQKGDVVTLVAAAAVASGAPVLVGAVFGVAQYAAEAGEEVEVARVGVYALPKVSAQAWTQGQKIYFDATNTVMTTTASGNTLVGAAIVAAANPSDTGSVLLDGTVR